MADSAREIGRESRAFEVIDQAPELLSFREEVLRGLSRARKRISPKFFYDRKGSELFEKICQLEEYYPTRTEIAILRKNAGEIARLLGRRCLLLEFGSGASVKIRLLLDQLQGLARYVPIDISKDFLIDSARILREDYPDLKISAVCADFTQPMDLPEDLFRGSEARAVFFPGSTIGNFEPLDARLLLSRTAKMLGQGGFMLLGVDLVKERETLNRAYNDSLGVTRDFNLNLIDRINFELDGDFERCAFEHRAFFNEEQSRIEMHLESQRDAVYHVGGRPFRFQKGETIHTESSYKYTPSRLEHLATSAGFLPVRSWTDSKRDFMVILLKVAI